MVSQKVVIKNPTGLHLRPAEIFAKRQFSLSLRSHFPLIM